MKKIVSIPLFIFAFSACSQADIPPTSKEIDSAIANGMAFLHDAQLDYGEFRTYRCEDDILSRCVFDSSPFVTTFVLYETRDVEYNFADAMREKALQFLQEEEQDGGVWSYWSKYHEGYIDPDLDDTSVVSFALSYYNKPFSDNRDLIHSNKDDAGLFKTWFRASDAENDIDCVVNANVLLYLQVNDLTVCDFINTAIKEGQICSLYYRNIATLYYMVARAYAEGISCFEESRQIIIQNILATQDSASSFGNALLSALSLATLQDLSYTGVELNEGVVALIEAQQKDGSWPRATFYFWHPTTTFQYASEELTTALAIGALQRFRNANFSRE